MSRDLPTRIRQAAEADALIDEMKDRRAEERATTTTKELAP